MIATWTNNYVGIPFKEFGRSKDGLDCFGLVMLVFKEQFSKQIHDYASNYESTKDKKNISHAVLGETRANWDQVPSPKLGDVIVLKIATYPVHMGVMIDDRLFIHAEQGLDVSVGDTKHFRWRNRIDGYYRHK